MFQSPPSKIKGTDNSQTLPSAEKTAAKQFLNIISPGRRFNEANKSHLNTSLLSALFPSSPGCQPNENLNTSMSPYRSRSSKKKFEQQFLDSNMRNNEGQYRENLTKTLKDQGYEDQEINKIQSNMILYKSIASVQQYREYMKDRMRKARDNSRIKSKVSTVNTKYMKSKRDASRSGNRQSEHDNSLIRNQSQQQINFGSSQGTTTGLSNARSQKILEIENLLNNNYVKRSLPYKQEQQPVQNQQQQQERQITMENVEYPDTRILNQRQQQRNSILNSVEELKQKEQLQNQQYDPLETSNDDFSRDLMGSPIMQSPPPKPNDKPMKIAEIISEKKQAAKKRPTTSKTKKQDIKQTSNSSNIKQRTQSKFTGKSNTTKNQARTSSAIAPERQQLQSEQTPQQNSQVSATPMRKKAKVGGTFSGNFMNQNKVTSKVSQEQLSINVPTAPDYTTMNSPISGEKTQKQQFIVSSVSQTSMFRSPQMSSRNKLVYRQDNDEAQYQSQDTEVHQVKGNDITEAIQYQRKKDNTVQQLLEEFKMIKTLKQQQNEENRYLKRGESPTKRLIELKKASHVSHPSIKEVKKNQKIEYSIKYVSSPEKSYLVNPTEGEINYDDAYKNYDKFYDRVMNQKIVKYKIKEDVERKNENSNEKWFKTPNKVVAKEMTRGQNTKNGLIYVGAPQKNT